MLRMGATSIHFSNAELACRHCGVNGCGRELLNALEAFRTAVGAPVTVDDAYRCAVHNKAIGGAENSRHPLGEAADISVPGKTAAELEAIARTIPLIRGIGRGDVQNYIHVDVREKTGPEPAEWCYDEHGKEIAYFPPADIPAHWPPEAGVKA